MSVLTRFKERTKGLKELNYLLKHRSRVLIVHYSCESFLNPRNRVPRITSIAIRNLESGQTTSFSIYLTAQIKGANLDNLSEAARDRLEKETLIDFYKFIRKHRGYKWVHWRMQNQVYGFEAINARYRILGRRPENIADSNKYDLPAIIEHIYTSKYEKSSEDGRMLALAKRNNLALGDAIPGYQEALAYEDGSHQLLWMSSQGKVKIIADLLLLTSRDKLNVAANFFNVRGLGWEMLKNTYAWGFLVFVGGIAGKEFIKSLFEHYSLGTLFLSLLGLN